jgi:hypothetical protein
MNYDDMILAHSRWKARLKDAIEGTAQINVQTASRDDQCDLGKWIHGDGKNTTGAAYHDLKKKHAEFHAVVGRVLNQARSCPPAKALELLNPTQSEFGRASVDCINAIAALRTSLNKK